MEVLTINGCLGTTSSLRTPYCKFANSVPCFSVLGPLFQQLPTKPACGCGNQQSWDTNIQIIPDSFSSSSSFALLYLFTSPSTLLYFNLYLPYHSYSTHNHTPPITHSLLTTHPTRTSLDLHSSFELDFNRHHGKHHKFRTQGLTGRSWSRWNAKLP